MHVGEIIGERRVERRPVLFTHRLEAAVVGTENVGFGGYCHGDLLATGMVRRVY